MIPVHKMPCEVCSATGEILHPGDCACCLGSGLVDYPDPTDYFFKDAI